MGGRRCVFAINPLITCYIIEHFVRSLTKGHEIVATIAQIHLHPTTLPKLCSILNFTSNPNPNEPACNIATIATWADRVRYLPQYRWTASLHYVNGKDDYPSQTCAFPGSGGWKGGRGKNLLAGIRNVTGILQTSDGEEEEIGSPVNEALKFLVHFMGDLHMPLHLAGRERGGNGIHVLFDGRHTSECPLIYPSSSPLLSNSHIDLHSLWDGLLIAQGIRNLPANYSRPLPFPEIETHLRGTIYDSYIRKVMWVGIMGQWKDDIDSWISCPPPPPPPSSSSSSSFGGILQTILSLFSRNVADETDDDMVCPYAWAKPINELNCDFIFPKALDKPPYNRAHSSFEATAGIQPVHPAYMPHRYDSIETSTKGATEPYLELDTPEYAGKIRKDLVVEKLLAQAGIRLAGVLNWLFADLEDEEAKDALWTRSF